MFFWKNRQVYQILLKETLMKVTPLAFVLLTVFWVLAEASPGAKPAKVPLCDGQPDFVNQHKEELTQGIEGLPKLILVGRKAFYYVESKNGQTRMQSEQDFENGKSKVNCATLKDRKSQSFSLYAPVLLDLTGQKSIKNTLWQFQVMANAKEVGVWNQMTVFGSKWTDQNAKVKVYQITHEEYEILLTRETENKIEHLSVRFDVATP